MAKKRKVNKTKAVAGYVEAHPEASAKEVSEGLWKDRIKITPAHVANIKSKLKKMQLDGVATVPATTAPAGETAPPAVEKPAKPGGTISLEQIKKVAQTVKTMGGFDRLRELLEVVREVGGLRRFKELLDAMSATEVGQAQP